MRRVEKKQNPIGYTITDYRSFNQVQSVPPNRIILLPSEGYPIMFDS
jgi:hypothetical protein